MSLFIALCWLALTTLDTHSYYSYCVGIDLAATDVAVYNNVITNYDDAIVAKPCNGGGKYCQCSGNMDIYNNKVSS